jgi:hypothetical protein
MKDANKNHTKAYLGDGVYALVHFGSVMLTTENGIATTNIIALEPEVLENLDKWIEKMKKENVL